MTPRAARWRQRRVEALRGVGTRKFKILGLELCCGFRATVTLRREIAAAEERWGGAVSYVFSRLCDSGVLVMGRGTQCVAG